MRLREINGIKVRQYQSPNQGGAMTDHHGIVLHSAEGTYWGTIAWQMNPDQRYADGTRVTTCSHWIVGRAHSQIAQMVDADRIAWCQRQGSLTWLSIELAGRAPAPPTEWQIDACAHILAWAHRHYGIPLAVADHPGDRGLGHHSMDREQWGEEWGHEACPGAGIIAAKKIMVERAQRIVRGDEMTREDVIAALDEWVKRPIGWSNPAQKARMAARGWGELPPLSLWTYVFEASRASMDQLANKIVALINEKSGSLTRADVLSAIRQVFADAGSDES